MKIINIELINFEAPLKNPFITSLRKVTKLEDFIVKISCSNGLVGYGEGAPTPVITGDTKESIVSFIQTITPKLIGQDLEEFDSIIELIQKHQPKNTTPKSMLDMAMYDLIAKIEKQPLYKLLGGIQQEFNTDLTISLDNVDNMVKTSLDAVSLGYKSLKIKLGAGVEDDITRIKEIYRAIPKDTALRLDANQGWSVKESIKILNNIEDYGIKIELLEQPIKATDLDGLKQIKNSVQTPILADEAIFTIDDAKKIIQHDMADYLNIKLAKSGGISQAIQIAKLCEENNKKCMIGCMLEGPIAIAAALHFTSNYHTNIPFVDLDAVNLLSSHTLQTNIVFNNSEISLSNDSGLGIEV